MMLHFVLGYVFNKYRQQHSFCLSAKYVCGVSTANSQLIHRKYSVTAFIISTTNWQVMLMGHLWQSEYSGRCYTCNEVFVTHQIIIMK